MGDFNPELGQLAFGQPHQEYDVPQIWDAALDALNSEIERVWLNTQNANKSGPMSNSGAKFDCDVFSAHAFSWGDEEQSWNFKWREVRISWYKYAGRGMSANMELTPNMAAEMLSECIAAVQAFDVEF